MPVASLSSFVARTRFGTKLASWTNIATSDTGAKKRNYSPSKTKYFLSNFHPSNIHAIHSSIHSSARIPSDTRC